MKTVFEDIVQTWSTSNRTAVIDNGTATSYRDLFISAQLLSQTMATHLPPNPVIAICANHGLTYVQGLLACIACNALLVPINPAATTIEKQHILENSGADALLLEDAQPLWGSERCYKFGLTLYVSENESRSKTTTQQTGRMLIYTSGTTSKPKGVLLCDRSLSSNIKAVANNFGLCPGDRTIVFSPSAYAMAMTQVFSYLWSGATVLCWPHGLRYPGALMAAIEEHALTGLTLSPSAARIIKKSVDLSNRSFSSLRYVSSGGMPIYAKDVVWYRELFPNARVISFYGCTENSPRISHYWTPPNIDVNSSTPLPVGRPLDGVNIKVVNPEGNQVAENTVGEIYIQGTSLMSGYWKNPEFTASKFDNGWFKTGDSGFFDSDGNLNLCGRVDNVFSVGHEKVAPEEVEAVITQVPGVEEAVLCHTMDPLLDAIPVALVVTHEIHDTITQAILRRCRTQLSTAKIPRVVLYVNEIPKTPYGKTDRRASQVLVDSMIGVRDE